jgi:hypothetical protein
MVKTTESPRGACRVCGSPADGTDDVLCALHDGELDLHFEVASLRTENAALRRLLRSLLQHPRTGVTPHPFLH